MISCDFCASLWLIYALPFSGLRIARKADEVTVMKLKSGLVLLFLLAASLTAYAQETASAAESVEKLKAQLLEVQGKEDALHARLQQLDESIKPENI